jgi:hypothetical protein
VLISDGEDHDEAAKIAGQWHRKGDNLYRGHWFSTGSVIIDEATSQVKTDNEGNAVISKLNETVLGMWLKRKRQLHFISKYRCCSKCQLNCRYGPANSYR